MTIVRDFAENIQSDGDLIVSGDLQVSGTTTTVNSTTVEIGDKNIVLGATATANSQNDGGGISILLPDASPDEFATFTHTGTTWNLNDSLSLDDGNLNLVSGVLQIGGTTVVDASRNLTNIGTVTADGLTVDGTGAEVISVNSTADGSQIAFDSATTSSDWLVGIANDATDDFLIYQGGAGAGDIRLYTDGAQRLTVLNGGNVGIGTDSPNRVLHVEGTVSTFGDTRSVLQISDDTAMAAGVGGGLLFTGKAITGQGDSNTVFAGIHGEKENATSTNTAGAMVFSTRTSGSNPAERMRIDSSGNVGIGVTPEAWNAAFPAVLQVGTAAALTTSGGDNARLFGNVWYDGTNYKRITSGYAHQYEQTGGTHRWYIGTGGSAAADSTFTWSESMRIDSSGNVGIGTDAPAAELHVDGKILTAGGSESSPALQLNDVNSGLFSAGGNTIAFSTDGTERMRIDSSGNVGIGTDSLTGVLTSYKSTNGDPVLGHFYNDNAGTATEATVYVTNSSTINDGLFLQTTGTAFTTVGGFVQDAAVLGSGTGASGGLSIMTRANADMRFYTNGHTNERMRIDSSGNVGIGGITPTGLLTLGTGSFSAAAANTSALYTSATAGLVAVADGLLLVDRAGADVFKVDTSGNVGIGTSSPNAALDVLGSTGDQLRLRTAETEEYQIGRNASTGLLDFYGSQTGFTGYTFGGVDGERMRIDSNGNLLVGTTSASIYNDTSGNGIQLNGGSGQIVVAKESSSASDPALWLNNTGVDGSIVTFAKDGALVGSIGSASGVSVYIHGGTGYSGLTFGNDELNPCDETGANRDAQIDLGDSLARFKDLYLSNSMLLSNATTSSFMQVSSNVLQFGTSSNDPVAFYSNNAEAMRLDASGNLLVGTNTVNGKINFQGDGTSTAYTLVCTDSAGNGTFQVRDDGLINTGLSTASLYNLTTANAANVHVLSNGTLYRSTSSERYKNTIQNATHGLTELLTLRPVTYKGNDDGDLVFGGLIAEEVHDAGLTEFVQYNEENQPDALAYGNMVSLCIKAIQEQQDLIESLTARIAQLEGAN